MLFTVVSLLAILAKGQPVFVRKKILPGLLILSLTAPSATVVSCKSKERVQKEMWQKEGWIDNNTFRTFATGLPQSGAKSVIHKKGTARAAAIILAQHQIIERFKGAGVESCGGMPDYEKDILRIEKELMPVIKNGKVVAERYDNEFNCDIVYEINLKDLKKKVYGYTFD